MSFPVMMGDCGCLNCGAGDFTIGEQTFQDVTYYPNDPTLTGAQKPLNGGAVLPRGAYFLKYCGGYYKAQVVGQPVVYMATQELRVITVNPSDLPNPIQNSFPGPWSGIIPIGGGNASGYDTPDKLAIAEGCLGVGFYNADNSTAPNAWLLNLPISLIETPDAPPKYRLYRYTPQLTLAYFYLDYGLNAWNRGGVLYSWRAYIGLINPARAPWQLNASFRATGGVSQSSTEALNAPGKSITEISVYYNVNPATKYNSQLALTLTDGVNTNADIAIDLTPRLFIVSADIAIVQAQGQLFLRIGNMGFGQINVLTATLSGPGIVAAPGFPGSLTGTNIMNGFGSNRLQHETSSNFATTSFNLKYASNPANGARTGFIHLTSPGADYGTLSIPIPAG